MIPPPRPTSGETRWPAVFVTIVILVFATWMRCLYLDKSVWSDEANSFWHSTAVDFGARARLNEHPPLYFWILRQLVEVTRDIALLRLFSVFCGILSVMVLLRAVPGPAGWLAGFVAAGSPELVYQSQELRHYALLNLLLLIALLCTLRLCKDPTARLARIGLAISAAVASSTHLATAFFILPLALVLLWSHRHTGVRRLVALAGLFAPAAGLLFYFHRVFLATSHPLSTGQATWWMAPATWSGASDALSAVIGWSEVSWLARALSRHLPPAGSMLFLGAAAAAGFVLFTTWSARSRAARTLLAVALLYWAVVIGYSFLAVSILIPRILLPGFLPLALAVGLGVVEHVSVRQQRIAAVALGGYVLAASVPWLWHFAWVPREDLRSMVEVVRNNRARNEVVIFANGTDVALDVYWPEFRQSDGFARFSLLEPSSPQFERLRAILSRQAIPVDVLVAYRVDGYFLQRTPRFDQLIAFLRSNGRGSPEPIWEYNHHWVVRLRAATARVANGTNR